MSNETKWTPGPWEVTNGSDVFARLGAARRDGLMANKDDGWQVADCGAGVTFVGDDIRTLRQSEQNANAHLIAAAPELYGALEEIVKQSGHPNISGWVNIERSIAALAKARGES